MFRLLDISHDDPAMNLALDEALLDSAESGRTGDTLRFWESPVRFVVLGTAQVLAAEVHDEACRADGVAILRRCTAGGCVLQGPGSLNFSLAISLDAHPEARALHASYCWILQGIAGALRARGVDARFQGVCDLAVGGRKVSGNAQRRRRRAILHHGTLLYAPGYAGMTRYLKEPAQRPEYRGALTHQDFVGALPLAPAVLRAAVCEAFGVIASAEPPTPWEDAEASRLAQEKYSSDAWNRRR